MNVRRIFKLAAVIITICVGGWCWVDGPVETAHTHGAKVNARTYHLRVYDGDDSGAVYELSGSYDWWDQSYQDGRARGVGRRVQ
jgi:hypothetical protein